MNDKLNELTQFSPLAGTLALELVSGATSKKIEHENDVTAGDGLDRTMFAYAPKSGCPDPKQCQVLMVLRDDASEESAIALMDSLGLQELCEAENFLLLFPNPVLGGWNYKNDPCSDNDMDFLNRCFGALRSSQVGVNGFNGMIFYIATSQSSSALLMTMAAEKPLNVPAMMIGPFPDGYEIPSDALNVETAAWVSNNAVAAKYLTAANGVSHTEAFDGGTITYGTNPNVRLIATDLPIDKSTVLTAWDTLFCETRRWQNDTYGTYQVRTRFVDRGFTAHVSDSSLGCNDNFPHTWYEYIPPQLRGTDEKVPLVFYFHGVNCVPLYGAEQSNWHDVADDEGFIVVYPAPAINKAWNIFNDPSLPSDYDFVMALIEHMKKVHPIDETRIYATGFSMGGMMTHALTAVYPDIFAAGAPCNAFDFAYFKTPEQVLAKTVPATDISKLSPVSVQRQMADEKKASYDYRMPIFQNVGYVDSTICLWPVDETTDDVRTQTLNRWKEYNNIPTEKNLDSGTLTGLAADEGFYEDEDKRFYHQRWHSDDEGNPVLLELVTAKRMPHAIDPVQIRYAWEFIKKFRRMPDGNINTEKEKL